MADQQYSMTVEFRNKRWKDATIGLQALAESFETADQRAGPKVAKHLKDYLKNVANALATKHGAPWPSGTTPVTLSKRSGSAMASLRRSPRVNGRTLNSLVGQIGGNFYLASHEFGAVITPKRAKKLTVPLKAALNGDGTPKKARARQWRNTFIMKSKDGRLFIARRNGQDVELLYRLMDKVVIPARLGLGSTLNKTVNVFIDAAMTQVWMEAIGG